MSFHVKLFTVLKLLFPPRVRLRLPNRQSEATDITGKRYGDYFWLTFSFGHLHFNIFPKHVRKVWMSIFLSEALGRQHVKRSALPPSSARGR